MIVADGSIPANLRSKVSPEDLVQEAYLRAFRSRESFKANITTPAFRTWLLNILRNVLIDTIREYQTDKRNIDLEASVNQMVDYSVCGIDGFFAADQTSPSMAAHRNERYSALNKALSTLPANQREVIILHHLQSLPMKEIAQLCELSLEDVTKLLRQGLRALRLHDF